MPSFRTAPNSFQKVAYFCGSSFARRASRSSTRLARPPRMASTSGSCCRSSREMFSGRSLQSTTPLTNRRYSGRNCSASSMMNTRGLKLYVRRVFIMDDAEQFLPLYLRFVKGVVDCSDLPLNISRELLQQDPEVEAIRGGLAKRVLDLLARLAKDEPQKYATFWKEFGAVLKEG